MGQIITVCMTCGEPVPGDDAACVSCGAWDRGPLEVPPLADTGSERLMRSVETAIRSHAMLSTGRARQMQRRRAVEARLHSQAGLLEVRIGREDDPRERAALELTLALLWKEMEATD